MKLALLFINFLLFPFDIDINCLNCSNQNSFSVLLITETKGWVHDSIESGIDLIVDIGDKKNFNVYHSDDSEVITTENLKEFNSIIFLNTTGDILNNYEQKVMESFIKNGNGFVGVHAASALSTSLSSMFDDTDRAAETMTASEQSRLTH